MADAAAEALTPEQQAQTSRVKRMLLQIRQKEEPSMMSGGGGIKRNAAAASNEQWAMTMQSSMRELTEEQTSGHLVEERAAAYFANIESLRLLALQIVKGSAERPGYCAAGTFSQTYGGILTVVLLSNDVPCCWQTVLEMIGRLTPAVTAPRLVHAWPSRALS